VTPGNEVFSFNPLHDLESILWITLWILTHYTAGDTLQPEQLNLANKFFDGEETLRFDMMRSVNFSSSHFPSEFSHAVKALNDVRSALAMKYTLFETDLAVNHARGTSFSGKFDGIHQELINIHRKAAASSEAVFLCYDNEEANEDSDVEAEHRPKRFRTIADSNYAIGHGDGEEEQ
jgi:hypothetical protein